MVFLDGMTKIRSKALAVHLLTATGAVFAMLATLEAVEADWNMMFLWLVVAFMVDGIDGPLARRYDVKSNAPTFDGALLDLIIDYLTYVFVPAYALFSSGLLPGWMGWAALIIITYASAMYFADTRMKTTDYSFKGFPSCWNMVVLVLFALRPSEAWITLALVAALAGAMFLPLKFIHPTRTRRWRALSLPIAMAWILCAGWEAWMGFGAINWTHWGLLATSAYLLLAGIAQQLIYGRDG